MSHIVRLISEVPPTAGQRFQQPGIHLLDQRLKSYQLHSSLSLQSAPPFHSASHPLLSPSASSPPPSRSLTRILIVLPACSHLHFRTQSCSEPQSAWLISPSGLSFILSSVSKQQDESCKIQHLDHQTFFCLQKKL